MGRMSFGPVGWCVSVCLTVCVGGRMGVGVWVCTCMRVYVDVLIPFSLMVLQSHIISSGKKSD